MPEFVKLDRDVGVAVEEEKLKFVVQLALGDVRPQHDPLIARVLRAGLTQKHLPARDEVAGDEDHAVIVLIDYLAQRLGGPRLGHPDADVAQHRRPDAALAGRVAVRNHNLPSRQMPLSSPSSVSS